MRGEARQRDEVHVGATRQLGQPDARRLRARPADQLASRVAPLAQPFESQLDPAQYLGSRQVAPFTELLRVQSATIDGEAVCCGKDGLSDFDRLHSQAHDDDVFLYAFDLLELNGEDLRVEPLEVRKGKLERLLSHSSSGLCFVEHMEGDGPIIFRHACKLKLEGIVSKRKDLGYRSGPSKSWVKMKNPAAPAAMRVIEVGTW